MQVLTVFRSGVYSGRFSDGTPLEPPRCPDHGPTC